MTLWWIGNAVLIGLVAPTFVLLLRGVLDAARTARRTAAEAAAAGSSVVAALGPVSQLPETRYYVSQTAAGLARYGAAVDDIL